MDYSKSKFIALNSQRAVNLLLSFCKKIDASWNDVNHEERLKNLGNYFQWLSEVEENELGFKHVIRLSRLISSSMARRQLLDLMVGLERYLQKQTKDHDIFIHTTDAAREERSTFPIYIVLDHFRSAFNVGSIFRTSECMGVHHIYLVGYTPTPSDDVVTKTSMGTSKNMSWSHHESLDDVFTELKKKNIPIYAMETSSNSQDLSGFMAPEKIALLFGNERFGVDELSLKKVDGVLSIPMQGNKNSLNVASCMAICSYEITRQWKNSAND